MIRIIIKVDNRTIYNIQATRTNLYADTEDIGEYDVEETVSGFRFKLKNFKRGLGALVLTKLLVEKIIKKEN